MEDGQENRTSPKYRGYVLVLMVLVYVHNQLCRYLLTVTTKEMAQEIHYGDKECMPNTSAQGHRHANCNGANKTSCESIGSANSSGVCEWNYNGQGFEYQLLEGPAFIIVNSVSGVIIGFTADIYNRKMLLSACLIIWSVSTILSGAVESLWQIFALRFLTGMGEAACTPLASSIITDYFVGGSRGFALGVYNMGIYIGYSLSFPFTNTIMQANINGQSWRWAYYLAGAPGILLVVVMLLTLKHTKEPQTNAKPNCRQLCGNLAVVGKALLKPSVVLLFIAASVRNAGGFSFVANAQNYFNAIGLTKDQVSQFMSWVPLVGGSLGAVLGGLISDVVVKRRGQHTRVAVLAFSLVISGPFCAGFLYFKYPAGFFSLLPATIFGEVWIGICLAVIVDFVPEQVKTTAIAVFLFIITEVGGNLPLLVPHIKHNFVDAGYSSTDSLRYALYIMYPGCYAGGGLLFLLTLVLLRRDLRSAADHSKPLQEAK